MKKFNFASRLTAALLALVMVIPAAANAAEEKAVTSAAPAVQGETLYHWEATANPAEGLEHFKDNLLQTTNLATTHWGGELTVNTADGEKKFNEYRLLNTANKTYGLPFEGHGTAMNATKPTEGMKLQIKDFPRVRTQDYGAINLSFLYSYTPGRTDIPVFMLDKLKVELSIDGKNWLEGSVGMRSWTLVGNSKDPQGRDLYLIRIETNDLLEVEGLLPGDRIRSVRLKPFGDYYYTFGSFGMCDLTVTGWPTKEAFEAAVPNERDDLLDIGEEKMRQIVAEHAKMFASVPWTSDGTIYTDFGSVASDNRKYLIYGKGVLHHGLVYDRALKIGYEMFTDQIVDGKYIGGTISGDVWGADCYSYVYDAISRVSREYSFVIWQTQSANSLKLVDGIKHDESPTFTQIDILPYNTQQEMFEGYAKLSTGDVITQFTTGGAIHIRITGHPATVVRNPDGTIDPNKSYVLCYEQTGGMRYYFRLPDGSVMFEYYLDEGRMPEALQEYQAAHPDWEYLYCTSTYIDEKYTFQELIGTNYVPLTLKEYETGKVEDIDVQMILQPKDYKDITNGFRAVTVTDHHVIKYNVKLEDRNTGRVLYEGQMDANNAYAGNPPHIRNYAWNYTDGGQLDAKLAALTNGDYRIVVSVQAGPVTEVGGLKPWHSQNYDFSITDSFPPISAAVTANAVTAGQKLEVQVTVDTAFKAADVEVSYDTDKLTFVGGSVTTPCLISRVADKDGVVRIVAVDAASSGQLATLTFTAKTAAGADAVAVKSVVAKAGEGGGSQSAKPGSYSKLTVSANGATVQVDNVKLTDGATLINQSFNNAKDAKDAGWAVIAGEPALVQTQTGDHISLAGKKMSVLGDSISTYGGVSNDVTANSTIGGNAVYYPTYRSDMRLEDMWWQRVIDQTGMELLVNNSWSGDELNPDETPGKGLERVTELHSNDGTKPDVIVVCFGTNDASANTKIANNVQVFTSNYSKMLNKLAATYPDAQVFLMNLPVRDWYDVTPYNTAIRDLVNKSGNKNFHVVDTYNDSGITLDNMDRYTYDGLHPNPAGMELFAKAVMTQLSDLSGVEGWNTSKVMELTGDSAASYGLSGNHGAAELSFDLCFNGFGSSVGLYNGNKTTASLRIMNDGTGKGKLQYFNDVWTDTGVTGLEPGSWYTVGMSFTSGSAIAVTVNGEQKGTAALNTATSDCAASAMTDVVDDAWYHTAVDYALTNGLMSGYNATTFGPNDTLSRAMVVQVLYNKEGKPANTAGHTFPDVKAGDWFNNAVAWAAANKVVGGYGDGRFGPNDNVTLEQIAVILHNYSGTPAGSGDAAKLGAHSDWAANALGWAAGEGLFENVPFDALTATATRAQTAQLLMNFLSK